MQGGSAVPGARSPRCPRVAASPKDRTAAAPASHPFSASYPLGFFFPSPKSCSPSPVKVLFLPPSLISSLTARLWEEGLFPFLHPKFTQKKIKLAETPNVPVCARGLRADTAHQTRRDPASLSQHCPAAGAARGFIGESASPPEHPMASPTPCIAPMERGVCPQQGCCCCFPLWGICP